MTEKILKSFFFISLAILIYISVWFIFLITGTNQTFVFFISITLFFLLGKFSKNIVNNLKFLKIVIFFIFPIYFGLLSASYNTINQLIIGSFHEIKASKFGSKLFNFKRKIISKKFFINKEKKKKYLKENFVIHEKNFKYPIFLFYRGHGDYKILLKNENTKSEYIVLDDINNYVYPVYFFKEDNTFITFDTKFLMRSSFIDQSLDPIWISKTKNNIDLHHHGDSFNNKIYFSGGNFHNLPNKTSELFVNSPYRYCEGKNRRNETVEIFDSTNGDHIKTLELLPLIANLKEVHPYMSHCDDPLHLNDIHVIKEKNYANYFPNGKVGDFLISMLHINTIALVDKDTFKIKWHSFDKFRSVHSPIISNRGTIILFDNNGSLTIKKGRSRLVEIDIKENKVVGTYEATGNNYFYSDVGGKLQLVDDKIYITETTNLRMLEISCKSKYISNKCKQRTILEIIDNEKKFKEQHSFFLYTARILNEFNL